MFLRAINQISRWHCWRYRLTLPVIHHVDRDQPNRAFRSYAILEFAPFYLTVLRTSGHFRPRNLDSFTTLYLSFHNNLPRIRSITGSTFGGFAKRFPLIPAQMRLITVLCWMHGIIRCVRLALQSGERRRHLRDDECVASLNGSWHEY